MVLSTYLKYKNKSSQHKFVNSLILLYHFWVSNIDKLTEKQIHSISDKLYIVIQMIKIWYF